MGEFDLDLQGFAVWARKRGGYPLRGEDDQLLLAPVPDTAKSKGQLDRERDGEPPLEGDKRGEVIGRAVHERTIKQELAVLDSFQKTMNIKKLDPENFEALYEGLSHFMAYLKTRTVVKKKGEEPKPLSPATIERYLIVVRRYMRFVGRPAAARTVPGPYRPKEKKGPIPSAAMNAWLKALPAEDSRLSIITWLLLAGVDVGDLPALRYDDQVMIDGNGVEILVDGELKSPSDELYALLTADHALVGGRGPVLRSKARRNAGRELALTLTGLRSLWTDFRVSLDPPGPSMREAAMTGRRVVLRRRGRGWIYEYRETARQTG